MKSSGWISSSALNTIAQLVRMACGLVVIKMIAVMLGPVGMGKLGYFMSVISMLVVFAGGGISNGIIKYVAEYNADNRKMKIFMLQAFSYSAALSLIVGFFFIFFSKQISVYFFGNSIWFLSFIFIGIAQFGFAAVNFINGIINGLRRTKDYSIVVILGSVLGAIPAYWLTKYWGISGAVIAFLLIQLGMLVPSSFIFLNVLKEYKLTLTQYRWEKPSFELGKFSFMQLISVLMMFTTEVTIRNLIVHHAGWNDAGIWQGVMRLSYAYIGLFTSFLAAYYMPTISVLYNVEEIFRYLVKTLAVVLSVFLLLAAVVFIFKNTLFMIVLSSDFILSTINLFYQLTGDLFRILSYVIGFFVISRANVKISVLLEFLQAFLYISIAYVVIKYIVADGVYLSYMVAYFMYFMCSIFGFFIYYRRNLRVDKDF